MALQSAAHLLLAGALALCVASAAGQPQPGPALAGAGTRFGFDVFRQLCRAERGGNVLMSPVSVQLALCMAYNGARETTQQAMARTLHLEGLTLAQVNEGAAALRDELGRTGANVQVDIANAVWSNRGEPMLADFVQRCTRFYGAEASSPDFADPATLAMMNDWFRERTHGKVTGVLTAQDLRRPAVAVLANAVYFKAPWLLPFPEDDVTRSGEFHLAGGATKSVPMMRRTIHVGYLEGDGLQAVRLPYTDKRFAMYVFLPAGDLDTFLGRLTPAAFGGWVARFQERPVDITLPRFRVDYAADLVPPLTALGMGQAFQPDADFTAMVRGGHVFISKVKHKARLEVTEKGTEAAAATAVIMNRSAAMNTARFVADRPFVCAIADSTTGVPLFLAAVRDPMPL